MSFVYEVNLEVEAKVCKAFEQWLTPHIEEMLSFAGFQSAHWYTRNPMDEEKTTDISLWTVQYLLDDEASYLQYINTHAARMRKEGLELFGGSFHATRRLLRVHTSFSKQ